MAKTRSGFCRGVQSRASTSTLSAGGHGLLYEVARSSFCGSATSTAVIEFLTGLFDRFGLVEEVVTDNGVQFTSSEFAEFLQSLGIRHCRTALYSPQANAEAERMNRVLKDGIKAAMAEGKSFRDGVRQTLAAYRTTAHGTTGVSPASLMLAFPVRTPLSVLSPVSSAGRPTTSTAAVEKRVRFQQQKAARAHDRRTRATPYAANSR
jgi:transposase InsO family protein